MVAQGKSYLSSDAATGLITALKAQTAAAALNERETTVLRGIAEGRTHKEIADQLGLTVKSVEAYRTRLATKLKCRSRAELVRLAVRMGLVAG